LEAQARFRFDYQALGTNLRLLAAYMRSKDLDRRIWEGVGQDVNQEGRSALLDRASGTDMAAHREHVLESHGIAHHANEEVPRATYEEQLNRLLAQGKVSDQLEDAAAVLFGIQARMARRNAAGGVVRVQATPPGFDCNTLANLCSILSATANIMCALSLVQPEFVPVCALMLLESGVICLASALCPS
jgi:hypothetical protein